MEAIAAALRVLPDASVMGFEGTHGPIPPECMGKAYRYLRLIDFLYHSTLGLIVIKKKKKDGPLPPGSALRPCRVTPSERPLYLNPSTPNAETQTDFELPWWMDHKRGEASEYWVTSPPLHF